MNVTIGIIVDKHQRLLITQRNEGQSYSGYWEFPGGKLEAGESASRALIREIQEEVGLKVTRSKFLDKIERRDSGKQLILNIFMVTGFEGVATPREQQMDMRWIKLSDLKRFAFPPANELIFKLVIKELKSLKTAQEKTYHRLYNKFQSKMTSAKRLSN